MSAITQIDQRIAILDELVALAQRAAAAGPIASVSGTLPIVVTAGANPVVSINAATDATAGSLSAADKTKLDGLTPGAAVASVGATAPLANTGSATAPVIAHSAGTGSGLIHQTGGSADVAAVHGAAPGQVPATNAGVTDAVFGFIFGLWQTVTVNSGASPYTPAAGVIMINVDTSGGSVTINTPATPTDGQMFFVKPVVASATPIIIAGTAGATVEDARNPCAFAATGSVAGQGGGVSYKYQATGTRWIVFTGI